VAEGKVRALERGRPGRRYLLGAENWSVKGVFDFLAELTGLPRPRWRVPYPVALAVAYLSEFVADVATGEIPAATVTGVNLTRRRMHFDATRTFAELGMTTRPAADAIRQAVEWFRNAGWIN
jgi:dihydroflavonol-4-reductase